MAGAAQFYLTTPIYYVNDRPHIGHVYTTILADTLARAQRLRGIDTFFLTGTDEHAAKVAEAAAEQGLSPIQWADRNAGEFQATFARLGISNDDFIRTTQRRHTERVQHYVAQLLDSGDLYLGEYEGWYDAGEEEYVPDARAKAHDFKSPISGRPLVRRREQNYFFRLSRYADDLLDRLDRDPGFVRPEARRNEVIGRIREGLNDVPVSRTGGHGWGIPFPGATDHTVYVWIDALFNYLTAVDTDERRHWWPADTHLIGKDILWFHAAIWPAVLLALRKAPGNEWLELPRCIYAHSFWIHEGQKMSKSLGNFIDLEKLDYYVETYGLDALRYFLISRGPLGASDSDFAEARFIEVYNADLANALGNCVSRVLDMTHRYLGGRVANPGAHPAAGECERASKATCRRWSEAVDRLALDEAAEAALELVRTVDGVIEKTRPFQLAREAAKLPTVGAILYDCAQALRIASLLLWPVIPGKMEILWERLGCGAHAPELTDRGRGRLSSWAAWGQLEVGAAIAKGEALFPRHQS